VYKIQVGTAPTEQQFAIGVVFGVGSRDDIIEKNMLAWSKTITHF
jgi:hypothetical protein